jgi:hypothetical protein
MADPDNKSVLTALPDTPEFQYRFFCKLFDDMIIRNVCVLRRGELHSRGRFSCAGCSKDRIMTSISKRGTALPSEHGS